MAAYCEKCETGTSSETHRRDCLKQKTREVLLHELSSASEEVSWLRKSAAEYVSAQAHHMPESWRNWFKKRFDLVDVVPYGVTPRDRSAKAISGSDEAKEKS